MIRRKAARLVKQRLGANPAVALVGPRQSGKTTLAKSLGGRYFDLEQGPDRLRLNLEWDELVKGKRLVILDEVQAWPEVFPRLRGAIDEQRKRMGRFLLLGSVAPSLMAHVSESLAGRLALVELTPFHLSEVLKTPLRKLWCRGGYPDGGVIGRGQFPQWQQDYLDLLAHRDLPAWGLTASPQTTLRLLRMLAAVHGQLWNASQIGQSLGLTYHTVNGYMDCLDGAFLIRRLQPYHANLTKRMVKSPKIYWRDSGLLHALLHVADEDDLLNQPWVGASWEGFVIEQIVGALQLRDRRAEAYFLRTSDQYELDLVLDFGRTVWAVEIKLTASPGPADLDSLNRTADLIKAEKRFLVSQTKDSIAAGNVVSCSLPWFIAHI